jgi:NADH:ubiquinone oxidoreductase subunit
MPTSENFSFVRRVSQMGTLLQTFLCGREVGRDSFGNRYYCERGKLRAPNGSRVRQKRWVLYAGEPEPTKIPPEWHIWLHYTANAPISESMRKVWQKLHISNRTGTPEAWSPSSPEGEGPASVNYKLWKPEQA